MSNIVAQTSTPLNIRRVRKQRSSAAYRAMLGAQIQEGRPVTKVPAAIVADMLLISTTSLHQACAELRRARARTIRQVSEHALEPAE